MFQLAQESMLAGLAGRWSAGEPVPDLLEQTREALGGIRPDDLEEVRALVEAIQGRLAGPDGALARRAVLTLLDTARRRIFTRQLRPEQIDPWLALLLPALQRAEVTVGDVLRSREETDPKGVAMRLLGAEASELTVADLARRTQIGTAHV
jgi:long-chain acyl-CoA synthetase